MISVFQYDLIIPSVPDSLHKFFVFGIVGILASTIHLTAASVLNWSFEMGFVLSGSIGYVIGFIWSYIGHYHFTFKSSRNHRATLPRFAFAALVGFVINLLVVALCTVTTGTETIWFVIGGIVVSATVVFLVSNSWVMKD